MIHLIIISKYSYLFLSPSTTHTHTHTHTGTQKSSKPSAQSSSKKKEQGTNDDLLPKGIATRDFEPGSSSEIAIKVCY